MAEEAEDSVRERIQAVGGQAVSGVVGAVISSPLFDHAVALAAEARERAIDAQETARGLLNLSSRDEAERLERRVRVLSNRLEETEDRLDRALDDLSRLERDGVEAGAADDADSG